MKKIIMITGDHPRHIYLVRCLAESGLLVGWIKEVRESFLPQPPIGLGEELAQLFTQHFALRDAAEEQFFGAIRSPDVPTLSVTRDSLNDDATIEFLQNHKPSLVLFYGCHKISDATMAAVPATYWNTHGGLSPEYRGVTTHFWPSYFLEPQMTGMTLHEATSHLDGGAILYQTAGSMVRGDGLHQLAARTVHEYGIKLVKKLMGLELDALPRGEVQKSTGRLFKIGDWRPEHLRIIYDHYQDRIVDAVLDGEIVGREPVLRSVF